MAHPPRHTAGDKRLASMPDRTTNTIKTISGEVYRPTVINCYKGDLSTVEKWCTCLPLLAA